MSLSGAKKFELDRPCWGDPLIECREVVAAFEKGQTPAGQAVLAPARDKAKEAGHG